MNTQTFNHLKKTVVDFENKFCEVLPIEKIEYDEVNSQVRAAGHVTSMIPKYTETFKTHGVKEFPPITVQELSPGKFMVRDGNTRIQAAVKAGLSEIYASTYHDKVKQPKNQEWGLIQVQLNDHPLSSPNTEQDLKNFLHEQYSNHQMTLSAVGFSYEQDPQKYIEDAAKYYKEMIPNSGKNITFWKNAVKKALSGEVSNKFENYTKDKSIEFYKDVTAYDKTAWQGNKPGEISNGICVYSVGKTSHINPNTIGMIAAKHCENRDIKFIVLAYVEDLPGKKPEDVKNQRNKMYEMLMRYSTCYSWNVEIKFLPQIKKGKDNENMRKFINFTPLTESN